MKAYAVVSGDLGPTALAALLGTWYDEFQSKYELSEDPWGDPWSITVFTTRANGAFRTTHGLINLERGQRRITWGACFSLDLDWIRRQGLWPPTDLKWLRVGRAPRKHFVWRRESQARRAGWIPSPAQSSEPDVPSAGSQEIALSYWLPGGTTKTKKDETVVEVAKIAEVGEADCPVEVETLKGEQAMPTPHEQQDDTWSSYS